MPGRNDKDSVSGNNGPPVAIIGAGIAGLTAAFYLKQAGFDTRVFEANERVGGRIQSLRRGDFLFDLGAFIYLGSYFESVELMRELELDDQLDTFDAYGAMPRDGTLKFFDLNKPVRTILQTDYLSTPSKVKALKLFWMLLRHWKDLNYQDATAIAKIDTDTVQSYCERELNDELYQYLASVVVRGPWLANPEQASIGQLLWTLKNFFKPYFYGLEAGMDALPRALAEHLDVRLSTPVNNVADTGQSIELNYTKPDGTSQTETFGRCLITTTADQALSIFPQLSGVEREFFESAEYITSVNTHMGLAHRPDNPATYIMASPKEQPDLCGVIADHLKAVNRAPEGKGQITAFCRHEWCVSNFDNSDDRILDQVLGFIRPYYGDLSNHVEDFEVARWPRVVPIMRQGRFKQIAAYNEARDPHARVQFAGDLEPIGGVNAALVSGQRAARRIVESSRNAREACSP